MRRDNKENGLLYFPLCLVIVAVVVVTLLCILKNKNDEDVYINSKVKDEYHAISDLGKYHKYKYCTSLMLCGDGEVIEISKIEAEEMGRTGCVDCYPELLKIQKEKEEQEKLREDEIKRISKYVNRYKRFESISNNEAREWLKDYYKRHTDIMSSYDVEVWKDTLSDRTIFGNNGRVPIGVEYESYVKIIDSKEKNDSIYSTYKRFYENAKFEDKILSEGKEYVLLNIIELVESGNLRSYSRELRKYKIETEKEKTKEDLLNEFAKKMED